MERDTGLETPRFRACLVHGKARAAQVPGITRWARQRSVHEAMDTVLAEAHATSPQMPLLCPATFFGGCSHCSMPATSKPPVNWSTGLM